MGLLQCGNHFIFANQIRIIGCRDNLLKHAKSLFQPGDAGQPVQGVFADIVSFDIKYNFGKGTSHPDPMPPPGQARRESALIIIWR